MNGWLVGRFAIPFVLGLGALGGACAARSIPEPKPPAVLANQPVGLACAGRAQLIGVSFDGLPDRELLAFARENPVRFTFFVSGVFYVTDEEGRLYRAPGMRAGRSRLGFGGDREQVNRNRALTLEALALGHEIGSHGNGHFPGVGYSRGSWESEFAYFEEHTVAWIRREHPSFSVIGFRAPGLATSSALPHALGRFGFRYASNSFHFRTARPAAAGKLYELPMSVVRVENGRRSVVAMDYNIHAIHRSFGRHRPADRESDTRRSYHELFERQIRLGREPIHIAHHTGPIVGREYRVALLSFLRDVCWRDDVSCVRCVDLLDWHVRCHERR